MGRQGGIRHRSCLSKYTNYDNPAASGSKVRHTLINTLFSQHKMNLIVVQYAMVDLRPLLYWTLSMSKRHTVSLHHNITAYNAMCGHRDGVRHTLTKQKSQWKEDLYFAMKFAWQKLSKYYADVTPTTGMLLISSHILDPFQKMQSFMKWDKWMDIEPEDETFYTAQYQEAFPKYVENEYCAKRRCLPFIEPEWVPSNNGFPSATASGSGPSTFDPDALSSDDDEYVMSRHVAELTPAWSNHATCSLTAARLYLI